MSGAASRLRRAREVGVAGLARRVGDRLLAPARARERAAWRARYVGRDADDAWLAAAIGGGGTAADAMGRALAPERMPFFLDAADERLPAAFAARCAAGRARIVREADAALAGDLSWVVPGGVPDWHAALPGSGRWPLAASDETGIGAATPIGDVRLNWELSRCTHAVRLAQAAWCTREARYAEAAAACLRDFAAHNPPGRGVAWAHAQEAGIRAVAWLWVFHLVRPLAPLDAATTRAWLWLVLAQGDFALAHLADHPITHNHLVTEAAALAVLGLALPGVARAAAWRRAGLRILWRELAKQVDDEGVQAEHALHYHAFVLDSFLAALLLAERAGVAVPAAARARIERMGEVVALLVRGDGTLPPIGDTDAGRAFRLGGDPLDRRDALAAAAVAFERAEWGAIAGDAPGAFWLTGGRAVPGAGAAPPPGRARCLRDAGIAIARSGYDPGAEIVILRAGPTRFRADVQRSHMHADALSVLWRIGDEDVLLDPGTYLYSEGAGWRAALRGTAAHSCVVVGGRDQADVRTHRFGIAGETPARWLGFAGDATQLCAAAEHPADGAPRVRRRIAWRAGGPLALCDEVFGSGRDAVECRFTLPATTGEASRALTLPSGRVLRVECFGDANEIEVIRPEANAAPGPGSFAPRYGVLARGTSLRADAGTRALPVRIVTVLQVGAAPEPARVAFGDDGAIAIDAAGARIRFPAEGLARIEASA